MPARPTTRFGVARVLQPTRNCQHWVRKQRREALIHAEGHIPRPKTLQTLVPPVLREAMPCPIDYIELPATNGADGANIQKSSIADRVNTLEEVQDLGIRVYPWDGAKPVLFVDSEGLFLFSTLRGESYQLLDHEARHANFTPVEVVPALNVGVTSASLMGALCPAGSTVLLPSATISRSNTTIQDDETRASFMQYAAGGLFRWVDYGFQTEKVLKNNLGLYQEVLRLCPHRWKMGMDLYSNIADLKALSLNS